MDERHGVNLRAYGQRDPLIEYKREAFSMFEELMTNIKTEVATVVRATTLQNFQRMMSAGPARANRAFRTSTCSRAECSRSCRAEPSGRRSPSVDVPDSAVAGFDAMLDALSDRAPSPQGQRAAAGSVARFGRNDPCPCGSKKYKKCCGQGL